MRRIMSSDLATASRRICSLDRGQCIEELLNFRSIPLDFSRRFLSEQTLDRLRHILMAAHIRTVQRKSPASMAVA